MIVEDAWDGDAVIRSHRLVGDGDVRQIYDTWIAWRGDERTAGEMPSGEFRALRWIGDVKIEISARSRVFVAKLTRPGSSVYLMIRRNRSEGTFSSEAFDRMAEEAMEFLPPSSRHEFFAEGSARRTP